jgi:aminoglycoside phosphotransferase (APT) family kinase protein
MERLIEWLPRNIPPGDDTSIVHGDLRIDNLMFDHHSSRIVALLDWELSTLGHPLADLAYHLMSWRLTAEQFRGMAGRDLSALGIPYEAQYLRRYCERTGRNGIDPAQWEFYMAFSMFRLAAILQGIVKRALDGNAASNEALLTGRRARTIADVAWAQVERLEG